MQLRVGSFLCTAVVRQVCKTAVGLHFCVVLLKFVFFLLIGFNRKCNRPPKVQPELLTNQGHFLPQHPEV